MDERQVQDLLRNAADSVQPEADFSDRAERRYRRRRNRARVLAGVVVIAIVGAGVATAEMVGTDHRPAVAAPSPTSSPAISTTTSGPAGPVDPRTIRALSFVDAHVGFGLGDAGVPSTSAVLRTDDGGRTWRRVGVPVETEPELHFENSSEGVAWGIGPLETTTDGGLHWHIGDGPVDNYLAWAGGRLWAMTPCVQSTPCGSRPMLISDDVGRTWQPTAPLRQGLGSATIFASSKSVAYVVEPATDRQPGPWQLALTTDGGRSWTYESVPCASWTQQPYLAMNDHVLLLVCAGQPGAGSQMKQAWTSGDGGRHWSAVREPPAAYVAVVTRVGSTFVLGLSRGDVFASGDDGRSWHISIATVEGFPSADSVTGVGIWVATGRADANAGIWFSSDGIHWERRASAAVP